MRKYTNNRQLRTLCGVVVGLTGVILGLISCAPTPPRTAATAPATTTSRPAPEIRWRVSAVRRQTLYVKLDLPVVVSGTRIDVGLPAEALWLGGMEAVSISSARLLRTTVGGPMVDQLTGNPRATSDAGSYLVPLAAGENKGGDGAAATGRSFTVAEPMPVYLRLEVSGAQEPGEYQFPVTITAPSAGGGKSEEWMLAVGVADIALPTEPRVLGVATTTTEDLARIFPKTFGAVHATVLDRQDPDDAAAVQQLDTLVKAAQRCGVALFVEDIAPKVRVNEVGRVLLDWDAYDRLMQPYMDGTAFADRIPLQVWLAPVPPRRVRDSATQLMQYVSACAEHFADKGWVATPAFMHPALIAPEAVVDVKLREEIGKVLRLHMNHEMLAVSTPDANVPQARLWVVDDTDPRLPPAQALAVESSVRLWPWVCAARGSGDGVKGFVWRGAVARQDELDADGGRSGSAPLLVASTSKDKDGPIEVLPSMRLTWLCEGLNDTAMLGLLEKRSDPALVKDVLAGIAGRTGVTIAAGTSDMPTAPTGYLYAGWPEDKSVWAAMPGMLTKLVLANDPGQRVTVAADDPLYLQAKMWLAAAHRPAARVGGYRFSLRPSRDGTIVDSSIDLMIENPVDSATPVDLHFANLPGDFEMRTQADLAAGHMGFDLEGYAIKRVAIPLAGHLDALLEAPKLTPVELTEKNGGAMLRTPVLLPIYRTRKTDSPPRIDGQLDDWPADSQAKVFGTMSAGMRYLTRPDLTAGAVRMDDQPANARWAYDDDYLYVLIRCPQGVVSDERNNDWPVMQNRWWGTDGVQLQISDIGRGKDWGNGTRVVQLGFKPGGATLTRSAIINGNQPLKWSEGPPLGSGVVKYGISVEKSEGRVLGYVVEAAIPRAWFGTNLLDNVTTPAWRVNVLRHRANDLASMSWSGPVVNDEDVAMMGLLIGNEK